MGAQNAQASVTIVRVKHTHRGRKPMESPAVIAASYSGANIGSRCGGVLGAENDHLEREGRIPARAAIPRCRLGFYELVARCCGLRIKNFAGGCWRVGRPRARRRCPGTGPGTVPRHGRPTHPPGPEKSPERGRKPTPSDSFCDPGKNRASSGPTPASEPGHTSLSPDEHGPIARRPKRGVRERTGGVRRRRCPTCATEPPEKATWTDENPAGVGPRHAGLDEPPYRG
jgi:hypothetical protein